MLRIHKGSKDDPIIAESSPCLVTPGLTDIDFTHHSPLSTIELEHLHHDDIPCMTRFCMNAKVYYWNGHTELVSVETGEVLAQFYPSWLVMDVAEHKLGKLVVRGEEAKENLDIVVATALIVQERSDEGRQAVFPNLRRF